LLERAVGHRQRTAVVAPADAAVDTVQQPNANEKQRGRTYGRLLADANALAERLRHLTYVEHEH
jgi:hypothetical protein